MTSADGNAAAAHDPVAGYSGDQLANAAAIMNAGAALGLDAQGQTIGVMTAMGESSLTNIDHGDLVGPDSRGLFQQRDTWGTLAQRMDPRQAATFFFERLLRVPNWRTLTPTAAAHAVQINADPDHYTRFYAAATAVVNALTSGSSACTAGVSGDARTLAQNIMKLTNEGKVTWLSATHRSEVQAIADGQVKPDCGVDTRILQVITVATQTFPSVGVSDINRLCSGERPGAGAASAHVVNGGGHAVDFYAFDGTPTTGADANAVKLLRALGPVMADGSGTGQSQCRLAAGNALDLPMNQFPDTCNHVHVQVDPYGDEPMKLTS
ncbi:hypothetical protein ACMT9Y_15275 [Clavibacter tessellarius]|uniref:hypothetical protein n=1 Tax=Clavibacter tessellarius TaxID=31965 RepID=UPI0039E857C5